ncbi:uncharacterized protein perm1a [Paramisgurnus dabryanus]|uniref:uncharacterized protein perm1a n=1 Tax=Paramisgurnus dabryanus TaxID=90735 RepID=UPI0031F3BD9F
MDDFDYSLHISDQDWDTFYQECEACNLLSPGLASREDSGMSDIDEMGSHLLDLTRLPASAEADLDGPPDCEGLPVDNYLSKYGIRSPEQVLSGSEEDLNLQTVNLFFEQLKSVTVNEQSHAANCQSKKMDHLAGLIDKQVIQSIGICPSGRNAASLKGEITKQGEADTWGSTALEKPIMATFTNAQARASDSTEREPVVGGGSLSSQLITVGMKQEQEKRCYHLSCTESTELKQKPETKPPDKPKMANWTNVTDLNPAGESIAQLNTGNISDSNDSPVCQFPVSPSNLRRKRRKKKRMSSEPGEPGQGYEAQFRVHQSESEEERFSQREVINSLPTHFLQREHSSLPRVKMSSVSFNNDNLPLSFTNFGFDAKPQVGCTSMYNISKNTNDISLVNNGQLKAKVCQKSTLPQMDIVLHIQENYVEVNPIQTDSALQLRDTPSIKETLSESQSDKSATGCQRKSLLSPNISTAADSTEPLSSSVTLNLAEGACKDVSCMGNEIDCCAFNSEQSSPSKWKMTWTSDTQQSNFSMTENIDETESCLDGNSPKTFSQKGELVPPTDMQTFKISTDSPLGKIKSETKCCMPENAVVCDHETDEGPIQSMNNSSEISFVNTSLIQPENLTEESEDKRYNTVNEDAHLYHAVEDKSIGELCDETTRSSEHIHGLNISDNNALSGNGKDGHILSINNSREISIVNTLLIQPEKSTEESKGKKRYNGVNEDANLYHAVEEKSISMLSDNPTSSSEYINGLKMPEDPAVSDNGNDESPIQHINNHSEVLNRNLLLIKPESLTEESESKGHNSGTEDANLYHAVEEKSIGDLSDETTSSSEHIHGVKIPEHTSVSDHETFEGHIQSINNSSEILIANTSFIHPENSTEESKSKGHNSGTEDANLYHAVEEKSIGELSDKTTSSSEHINGLKMPEDPAVSDHRKDEGHIQSINNSSEISIVNTSLIQPENSTEESKGKRYNGVNEDANLYHAVEDKSIGELCDETTRSSELIDDLKRPEDIAVSDHGNDEGNIQHINNSSEVLNMKSSLIKPGNTTEESESKGHNSVDEDVNLHHAVEERIIGELSDETTRSRENICGLKMPEHISVSDHGKDESHIQSTNCNSSEVLNMNTAIIKPGNSTEESEVKGHNSVSEEDKSIGELCNLTSTSSESTCDHKKEMEMLSEDSTQNALADVSDSKSIDLESIVLNAPNQTPCPVYAISSFWNEMEKLTINDILRLRMIANAQHPSVLTQPEDGSIADATDAADSGYFTQPDDSKPDRLSEDMSFISDLDEDFTLQTPDCIKQEESSCELPSSPCSVTWQNDSDPAIVGDDVLFVSSETIVPEHLCKSNTQQCFRKICKNISVQNLQALESQPIRQMLRNPSLHSIHSEVEDPFYHVNTSYTTCLSDDEEVDSGGISFSEIIQYFLGDNEPQRCPSPADNAESYPRSFFSPFEDESSGKDKMVPIFSYTRSGNHQFPEAYDYFFPDSPVHSDEDDESDNASTKVETHKSTYPFEDEPGEKDEAVPVFSCSRSRNHQFPEAYDYFFPDSPVHSDEDDNDNAPVKVVTQKSTNHCPVAKLDTCEDSNPVQGSFFWTNLFSFRRVRRTAPSIPEEKSYSWALTPVKPLRKGIKSVTVMGPDDKPFPDTLYLNLENNILLQLTEQQKKCMEMQTVIADPRLDAPFLPLRQADMCLVCIAFASWVLKSANPGADTWKAALLANISALSAIRYLRRHKREEASLRQIEPA